MPTAFSVRREQDAGAVIVSDAGYEVSRAALPPIRAALLDSDVVAVTGPIRFGSRDGVHASDWFPSSLSVAAAMSNPRGIPPVWAVRGGCELVEDPPSPDPFALADAWIQLLEAHPGGRVAVLSTPIARFDLTQPTRWEQYSAGEYESALYKFLARHNHSLDRALRDVLASREVAAVRLGAVYTDALRRRESAAAEIAQLEHLIAEGRTRLAERGRPELDWGTFARTSPVGANWGYDRGGPVDRRYIRDFIASHSSDVRGRVLEVQEDDLTRAFGGVRVTACDVLDVTEANPRATVVTDLRRAEVIPDSRYDCIILTQTAHLIDDIATVIRECHRMLKAGGVLLATFPALSRLCLDYGPERDFWRLTPAGARSLLAGSFDDVDVEAFGNVKTAVAFLHGLGEQELSDDDYAVSDPYNPMLIGARARKNMGDGLGEPVRGIILAYHRVEPELPDRFDLNVSRERFEAHLSWLRRHATVLPVEDLLHKDPEDLPHDAVALTFDDGYVHHLEHVAPLLASLEMPATYFVTTAALDSPREFWWDQLERLDGPDAEIRSLHDRFVHATLNERDEMQRKLGERLKGLGSANLPWRRPLCGDEVRRLANMRGATIGAHGVHHLYLPDQPDDQKRAELLESRRSLEDVIGRSVRLFAYPHGAVDRATAICAREEFHWALTGRTASVHQSFDAASVPRLVVKAWDVRDLAERIAALRLGGPAPVRLVP